MTVTRRLDHPAIVLAAVLLSVPGLLGLTGCKKTTAPVPDWVFDSQLAFLTPDLKDSREALPPQQYRLVFPYICGDIYGSVTTGELLRPAAGPGGSLHIDLNQARAALQASLEPTEFSLSFLQIQPRDARVARLSPLMLQADGIEAVAHVEWIDAVTRQRLMLLYFDRPALISGTSREDADGRRVQYAIRAASPGYVWVGLQTSAGIRSTRWCHRRPACFWA